MHLCYLFHVTYESCLTSFQFHISLHKFLRLLNYTASYF
jgi:hypothetical protein